MGGQAVIGRCCLLQVLNAPALKCSLMKSSNHFLLLAVAGSGISSGCSTKLRLGREHGSSLSGSHSPFGCLTEAEVTSLFFVISLTTSFWSGLAPAILLALYLVMLALAALAQGSTDLWLSGMLVALVPSDINLIVSGLTENALPVRAALSSAKNWPTCGKVSGMQPRVCRIALEQFL